MNPKEFERLLQRHKKQIEAAMRRTLPVKAANMAQNHFKDNFRKSGFVNGGLHPWKPAKRIGKTKGADGQYKTLLSSRNFLYNSIQHTTAPYTATVSTRVPYAAVHNEGLRAGRGRGFQMPKRQFIGQSKELDAKVEKLIEKQITKILDNQ